MFKVKLYHDHGDFASVPHVTAHPYYPVTRAYAFKLARKLSGPSAFDGYIYGEVFEHDCGDWVPALSPAKHEAALAGDYDEEIPW